jgi:hypothetical protein
MQLRGDSKFRRFWVSIESSGECGHEVLAPKGKSNHVGRFRVECDAQVSWKFR